MRKHSTKEPKNMPIQRSNKECQCLCSVCMLNSTVHTITHAIKRYERETNDENATSENAKGRKPE